MFYLSHASHFSVLYSPSCTKSAECILVNTCTKTKTKICKTKFNKRFDKNQLIIPSYAMKKKLNEFHCHNFAPKYPFLSCTLNIKKYILIGSFRINTICIYCKIHWHDNLVLRSHTMVSLLQHQYYYSLICCDRCLQ